MVRPKVRPKGVIILFGESGHLARLQAVVMGHVDALKPNIYADKETISSSVFNHPQMATTIATSEVQQICYSKGEPVPAWEPGQGEEIIIIPTL